MALFRERFEFPSYKVEKCLFHLLKSASRDIRGTTRFGWEG